MRLRNKLCFIIFCLNVYFKMAASIGSHFEIIKSRYLQKWKSYFHAVCVKMCSFPNTFRQDSFVFLWSLAFNESICFWLLGKTFHFNIFPCNLYKNQGQIQKFWNWGAHNSRVPNYRILALTPFWISCSWLPLKICPPSRSTILHLSIWRYSQNEAVFLKYFG